MDELRARLHEIQRLLDDDESALRLGQALQASQQEHLQASRELEDAEREVQKQKTKIEQSEASLYSGSVKNPKELQDLQLELASLKRYLVTLEDRQLEAMQAEEDASQRLAGVQRERDSLKEEYAHQAVALNQERATVQKDLDRLRAERQATVADLDPAQLQRYDTLRQERNGVAVVAVKDGACSACGTTLTPSQEQQARSTAQLTDCPTCKRILFAN